MADKKSISGLDVANDAGFLEVKITQNQLQIMRETIYSLNQQVVNLEKELKELKKDG